MKCTTCSKEDYEADPIQLVLQDEVCSLEPDRGDSNGGHADDQRDDTQGLTDCYPLFREIGEVKLFLK